MTQNLQARISACVNEIFNWMRANQFLLNDAETELLWLTNSRRQQLLPRTPTRIGTAEVTLVNVFCDLSNYIDSNFSMRSHIKKTVSSSFAVLRQLQIIRRSVMRAELAYILSWHRRFLTRWTAAMRCRPAFLLANWPASWNGCSRS